MTKGYNDDEWRNIYQVALELLDIPAAQRPEYLKSRSIDSDSVQEILALTGKLEEPDDDTGTRPGTAVGRFQLAEYLGSGGAGEVFSARDPELGRMVAIKLLHPDQTARRDASERFIREARTASTLNHPGIVTVHEIVRTESSLAIVMELVQGQPLRHLLGKPMAMATLMSIGRQVADALSVAHAAGIVHRDIKPENVMVLGDGRIKLLDFGLARLTDPTQGEGFQTLTAGLPPGTLRYMSPEHYAGRPVTAQSDIFALGLVLYELATGRHPFADKPALEVLHAIATEEIQPPSRLNPAVPPRIDSLILQMLAKDRDQRPGAREIAAALQDSVVEPSQSTPRRPTFKWLVGAGMLLCTVAGLAAWRSSLSKPAPFELEQLTTLVPENRATAVAISADGKLMAYANIDGVFLRVIDTGETSLVKGPVEFVVDQLAWFPDSTKMLASGFGAVTNRPAIWLLSTTGSPARELRKEARFGVPSPDGRRIAFLSWDYSSIWTMDPDGQDASRLLGGGTGDSFGSVIWSADGAHLLLQRRHHLGGNEQATLHISHNESLSFDSVSADSGRVVSSIPNIGVWAAAAVSAGEILIVSGQKLEPQGFTTMWSARMDPGSGKLDSNLRRVAVPGEFADLRCVHLSSTRDGRKLMLLRQRSAESIFVADFQRAKLEFSNFHRLTLDESDNYPHAWTPDSRYVIFESNRATPSYDLFKQSVTQRVPESIITTRKRLEVLPQLAPDGKTILFASNAGEGDPYRLMRVPLAGGTWEEVPGAGTLDEFRCSTGSKGRCVIRTKVGRKEMIYSELDPQRGTGKELARTSWMPTMLADWDVSPDGNSVAQPNHDSRSARIRIIRLNAQNSEEREREVEIPGLTHLSVVTWAADGSGWFVSSDTTIGRRMYFYDPRGRLTSMGDISGWAVPSPDGRKVAFLNKITNGNAWLMSRPGQN